MLQGTLQFAALLDRLTRPKRLRRGEGDAYRLASALLGSYRIGLGMRYLRACVRRWPCLLYTSPSPRDRTLSRMPSSA